MKRKHFISSDKEYFEDKNDIISLESCLNGGIGCKAQLKAVNENLRLVHRLIEDKKHPHAINIIKETYNSTFEIKEERCQKCAGLFRETIVNSLNFIILDLSQLSQGILGDNIYKTDLDVAKKVLRELTE